MEGFSLNSLLLKICDQLDVKQYALPGKSTTQTLVYLDPCLIHLILTGLDVGQCSARLFFADFRKGFDPVNHNIIIHELVNINVHPVIVRWKSFLTNREQCVRIGKSISSWKTINGGLPQGPNLGPTVYICSTSKPINERLAGTNKVRGWRYSDTNRL